MKLKCIGLTMATLISLSAHAQSSAPDQSSGQQQRVMDYCNAMRMPLLVAGTQYVNLWASNTAPDDARTQIYKSVHDSVQYQKANAWMRTTMDKVVSDIADPEGMKAHTDAMMQHGERYVGLIGFSWANKTTDSFYAWCNYNRLSV